MLWCASTPSGTATITGAIHCWGGVDDDPARSRAEVADAVSEIYQQDFGRLVDRYLLHGTPDRVGAPIAEYRDAGADALVFCPVGSEARRTTIVESFAREVLDRADNHQQLSTYISRITIC